MKFSMDDELGYVSRCTNCLINYIINYLSSALLHTPSDDQLFIYFSYGFQ
jgi:hypothetical protein